MAGTFHSVEGVSGVGTYLSTISSEISWKDAIVQTIAEASKTIDYLTSVTIISQRASINGKKIAGTDGFANEFETILQSGYKIKEQQDVIAKKKFINGKRKKIVTTYSDVVITIDLGEETELTACFNDGKGNKIK